MSNHETRIVIPSTSDWSANEVDLSAKVVFLVLRAAQKDSLRWWDDESLTDAGRYAFDKLFPRNSRYLALRLAFIAAKNRHQGMLKTAGFHRSVTIWNFAEPILDSFEAILPTALDPIRSVGEFAAQLIHLFPSVQEAQICAPDETGILDLSAQINAGMERPIHFIELLAAGYLSAGISNPVFPFLRVDSSVRS